MRTVTLKSVLEESAALDGEGGNTLSATDRASLGPLVNRWVRRGWRFAWWPETLEMEERSLFVTWTAVVHEAGAVVYYLDKYWRAAGEALVDQVPGTDVIWEELAELPYYIPWDQAGQANVIEPGAVRAVYRDDPMKNERPRRLSWRESSVGLVLLGQNLPTTFYIEFRRETPSYATTPYDADESITTGARRYLDSTGECYVALRDGSGWNPATAGAYWARVEFPEFLARYVAHGIYADVVRGDGQNDKSLAESGWGEGWLLDELDAVERAGQGRVPRRVGVALG